jgi:hypothetical protein
MIKNINNKEHKNSEPISAVSNKKVICIYKQPDKSNEKLINQKQNQLNLLSPLNL